LAKLFAAEMSRLQNVSNRFHQFLGAAVDYFNPSDEAAVDCSNIAARCPSTLLPIVE
jgi:hypothetical protein